jgi:hypothetical protein
MKQADGRKVFQAKGTAGACWLRQIVGTVVGGKIEEVTGWSM